MAIADMVVEAQKTFPSLQIAYKDSSWLMKLLGALLFFAPKFMTSYVTTIGYNVYFPNQAFMISSPRIPPASCWWMNWQAVSLPIFDPQYTS
jgi:hypothetical protein